MMPKWDRQWRIILGKEGFEENSYNYSGITMLDGLPVLEKEVIKRLY